jgi:hypothetical protein
MNDTDHEHIDQWIRKELREDVPSLVHARLESQLLEFRDRLANGEPVSHRGFVWSRPAWLGASVAVAATIAVAIALAVIDPQTSFAEVATAALRQTWIHVREVRDSGKTTEAWYSPSQAISALRSDTSTEHRDYRVGVYLRYDAKEQVLYRLPDVSRNPSDQIEMLTTAMSVLLQNERTVEKPLQHLGFFGPQRSQMKVLDQSVERIAEGERKWLDYRMTVTMPDQAEPMRLLFRVDAGTKLPEVCRIDGHWQGKVAIKEVRFDYPDKGPMDVYEMGVPKTAQLVDRIPTGDLKRIWESLQAGRERMDDYRAVFVKHTENIDSMWWTDLPGMMYRKGDKLRADYVCSWNGDLSAVKRPGDDEDLGKWWYQQVKFFRMYPQYVMRGSTLYTSTEKSLENPDGSVDSEIVSVDIHNYNSKLGETFPPEWSMRPEFALRPPLGVGGQQFEPILELKPTEGPAGCILLRVRHTSSESRINDKGVGLADATRYWLDPQRDYIVMRWDMLVTDDDGKEQIHESDTTEEVARSPRGVWYATKVRRHFPRPAPNGEKMEDQVYHMYVDFDVDLLETFFDPPAPGRIR